MMHADDDAGDEAAGPPPPSVQVVYTVPVDAAAEPRDSFRRRRPSSSASSASSDVGPSTSSSPPSSLRRLSTDSSSAADAPSASTCSIRRTSISFEPAGDEEWNSSDEDAEGMTDSSSLEMGRLRSLRAVSLVVPRRISTSSGSVGVGDKRELIESVLTLDGSIRTGDDSVHHRMMMALREEEDGDGAAGRFSQMGAEVHNDEPWPAPSRLWSTRSRRRGRLMRRAGVLAGSLLVAAVLTLFALYYAFDEEDRRAFLDKLSLARRRQYQDEEKRSMASVVEPMYAASESYQDEGLEETLTVAERSPGEALALQGNGEQANPVKVRLHDWPWSKLTVNYDAVRL